MLISLQYYTTIGVIKTPHSPWGYFCITFKPPPFFDIFLYGVYLNERYVHQFLKIHFAFVKHKKNRPGKPKNTIKEQGASGLHISMVFLLGSVLGNTAGGGWVGQRLVGICHRSNS